MPCDRSTNRKHRRPPKNKEKLTSLQCRMASDIRAERQNSNVGRRPTYERKGSGSVFNVLSMRNAEFDDGLCHSMGNHAGNEKKQNK
ncbi:hypothetical protein J6590_022945 [Homalodisca vitripennis]|nr:hypothetical protein J6590_022945 [Homalodisca vitripennis]